MMRPARTRIGCLIAVLALLVSVPAFAGTTDDEPQGAFELVAGGSRVLDFDQRVRKVVVIDRNVADVEVLGPRRVLVYGRRLGMTDVILHFEDDTAGRYAVEVTLDTMGLQRRLYTLFGPGLRVDLHGGVLILSGLLPNVDSVVRLEAFMKAQGYDYVDMTSVPGVQQVLLKVRIAEVSRDALRTLAFSAVVGGSSAFGGFQPGADGSGFNPVGISPQPGTGISPSNYVYQDGANLVSNAATLFGGIPSADLALYINALTQNNYFRLLAEPNLVAISGEEASFLVGGEFPIPVVQGTSVGVGSSLSIEYKEVGVRLSFRPEVLGENRIRLAVSPEVSELSESFGSVRLQNYNVPGVLVRRSSTTVELNSGQTFAMAGLLQSQTEAQNASVPLLGDLPIIGPLFRSVRYKDKQTELVVLVTAELVEPRDVIAEDQPVPGMLHNRPDDWELFIEGRLEGSVVAPLPTPQADALRRLGLEGLEGPGAWKRFDDPGVPPRPDPAPQSRTSPVIDEADESDEAGA